MTPQEKDQAYRQTMDLVKEMDIHMDVHHALRHARWQALRLPEATRVTTLETIDDALHKHWQSMIARQHVLGRCREALDLLFQSLTDFIPEE